jgi:hypothetical protein
MDVELAVDDLADVVENQWHFSLSGRKSGKWRYSERRLVGQGT